MERGNAVISSGGNSLKMSEEIPAPSAPPDRCDIADHVPSVISELASSSGVTQLMLKCSNKESFVGIASLADTSIPIQSQKWVDQGAATHGLKMDLGTVILKRCGFKNAVLPCHKEKSVCSNHVELLSSSFPNLPECPVCQQNLNRDLDHLKYVTHSLQDVFLHMYPGLLLGSAICADCHRKLGLCRNKLWTHGLGQFTNELLAQGLIKEGQVKAIIDSGAWDAIANPDDGPKAQQEDFPKDQPWTILNYEEPFVTEQSIVPPLR